VVVKGIEGGLVDQCRACRRPRGLIAIPVPLSPLLTLPLMTSYAAMMDNRVHQARSSTISTNTLPAIRTFCRGRSFP